jgi:hypothetical protein
MAITPVLPGDISQYVPLCQRETYRNSSWTRDVNKPMAFTEILYFRYEIVQCYIDKLLKSILVEFCPPRLINLTPRLIKTLK